MARSRRALLAAIAGATGAVAGCGSVGESEAPTQPTTTAGTTSAGATGPTIVVSDQTTDGTHVAVDGVVVPDDGDTWWLGVTPMGQVVPVTDTVLGGVELEPGVTGEVTVDLYDPLREDRRLAASLWIERENQHVTRLSRQSGSMAMRGGDFLFEPFDLTVEDPPTTAARTTTDTTTTTDGTTTAGELPANAVVVEDGQFSPRRLSVDSGDTVTWVNRSDRTHVVQSTSFLGTLDLPEWSFTAILEPGERASHTFSEAGRYGVDCGRHSWETVRDADVARRLLVRECGAVLVGDATLDGQLPCERFHPGMEFEPEVRDVHVTGEGFRPRVLNTDVDGALVTFVNETDEEHVLGSWEWLSTEERREHLPAGVREWLGDRSATSWSVTLPPGETITVPLWHYPGYYCVTHGIEAACGLAYDHSGCSPSTLDATPCGVDATVAVTGDGFSPRVVEVPVDGVVEWENTSGVTHHVGSWAQLDESALSTLTDAQRELVHGQDDWWAGYYRWLDEGEDPSRGYWEFAEPGVYPFTCLPRGEDPECRDPYADCDGPGDRCGAVVVGDATLDTSLPCE